MIEAEFSNRPDKEEGLTPTLSGNTPGEPLYGHFHKRLPRRLNRSTYEHGLSCLGYARLIVLDLGGIEKAKIYWIEQRNGSEILGHAYVVPIDSKTTDLAFNNNIDAPFFPRPLNRKLTVKEVLKRGTDITEEIFKKPWKRL